MKQAGVFVLGRWSLVHPPVNNVEVFMTITCVLDIAGQQWAPGCNISSGHQGYNQAG